MSSSVHVDNKGKYVLILEVPTQGLDNTALIEEGKYLINFTQPEKRFALGPHSNSLHYNGSNSFLIVNATKVFQFKAKNYEIKYHALFLGGNSKFFTVNNMKEKTG